MDKSNLELFKQAISEGLSKKFDRVVNSYTDEVVCSEKHDIAMRTIVYGKANTKRAWSPKMKRIIAILIAAALLLTSCGIIFRNEIREVFENFFVKLTYSSDGTESKTIDEVYELTYLPEGYTLEKERITPISTQYNFVNKKGDSIKFWQRILNSSEFFLDIESGYSKILEIEEYDIYYRFTDTYHCYVWNDEKYYMKLTSSRQLSNDDVILILEGITIK